MATNQEIARHLEDIVFFYKQENQGFRAQAYEKAAEKIRNSAPLTFTNGVMTTIIDGVGESITTTVEQFHSTGTSNKFKGFIVAGYAPPEVQELQKIPQVGPATAKKIWKKFGITSLNEFGAREKEIETTEFKKYIAGYKKIKDATERLPAGIVRAVVDDIIVKPFTSLGLDATYAGSMRRQRETVRDVDVIVCLKNDSDRATIKSYLEANDLKANVRDGEDKLGIDLVVGTQTITLDLNFCTPENRGAYQMYLTGSKEFNVELRTLAKGRGLLLNQNGLFKDDKRIAGATEQEMFDALKVTYIPPECREEGCIGRDFTSLIKDEDIIVDLHSHSLNSDGGATHERMTATAFSQGLQILGISDHSQGSGNGIQPTALEATVAQIKATAFPVKVLCGAEIDVRVDKSLDYDEKAIEELDYFLLATHHGPDKDITERLVTAMEKYPTKPKILAHPRNVKVGSKPPTEADWDKIFKVCKATNTVVEINGQPERADSDFARMAIKNGVYVTINSDCHGVNFRDLLKVGVRSARRGWVTKDRVLNANLDLLDSWLQNTLYN